MNRKQALIVALALACAEAAAQAARAQAPAPPTRLDTARIEEITGLKGTMVETEGVFKVTSPRNDVKVAVEGWTMPPFMGLTSWASFHAGRQGTAMVMGDLVLFQDEVNPVLSALLAAGLEVTALHNHFFFDEPRVYFMHIGGEGPADSLAGGVRRAFDTVQGIRTRAPAPATGFGAAPLPATSTITAKPIEDVLGVKGQSNSGLFKVVIGRAATAGGHPVTKEMGVNTWAAFAGSDDNAVVDGDFAMLEGELQGVLKALRAGNVNIVAIHHHMARETPRILFLHYWGHGPAVALARAVKAALDTQGK